MSYPPMPDWSPDQQKLHDAITEAARINMPSYDMAPVFEYWAKMSREATAQTDR